MNYYILSQGTKSLDYSFMIKNAKIIKINDKSRELIRNIFSKIEKKGKLISNKETITKIIKYKNNYLIEVLTTNTDRLKRKIPVELLLENYEKKDFTNSDLNRIYILLSDEKIEVEKKNWNNILNQLNKDLELFYQKKTIKIISGITFSILTFFFTLKYLLKWI